LDALFGFSKLKENAINQWMLRAKMKQICIQSDFEQQEKISHFLMQTKKFFPNFI